MKKSNGFTLFELLIIMAIIGILASIIIPAVLGGIESLKVEYIFRYVSNKLDGDEDLKDISKWLQHESNETLKNLASSLEDRSRFKKVIEKYGDKYVNDVIAILNNRKLSRDNVSYKKQTKMTDEEIKESRNILNKNKVDETLSIEEVALKIVYHDELSQEDLAFYDKHEYEVDNKVERLKELKKKTRGF